MSALSFNKNNVHQLDLDGFLGGVAFEATEGATTGLSSWDDKVYAYGFCYVGTPYAPPW